MNRFRVSILAVLLVIPVTLGLARHPAPPMGPLLVVVLTVDQLRPDYVTRFQDQWQGGLKGLLADGAVFGNGRQDHALTETAPGHSTILSGRDPAHTGIALNELGVGDSSAPVLGFPDATGASPFRFKGTTLVDWMRKADSGLQVLSLSGKDRAAILPIGKTKASVYWYEQGQFTTSEYYADTLPGWLTAWNARRGAARLVGSSWTLLLPESSYPEPDSEPYENGGRNIAFPHRVDDVQESPWLDSLTLDVSLAGARAMGLGKRLKPDLLAIGLSATDHIGHAWGPDSREIHDHLLRLDRYLGAFFDSLSTLVPRDRILVVLTADHGVTSYPEYALAHGRPGGRIKLGAFVRDANAAIERRTGKAGILQHAPGLIYGDTAQLRALGVSPESLATALAPRVWSLPGVVNAWTPATLGGASPRDVHAVRWWRALPPKFVWLVCAVAKPGYIWADGLSSAVHGTTNPEDVDVPIVLMGPGVRPGVYADTVRTTDIGPTLARLLGVKTKGKLDGRPIKRIFK
jgi:Type I phosphodiesterase / nucleotide pyrophosphatase